MKGTRMLKMNEDQIDWFVTDELQVLMDVAQSHQFGIHRQVVDRKDVWSKALWGKIHLARTIQMVGLSHKGKVGIVKMTTTVDEYRSRIQLRLDIFFF